MEKYFLFLKKPFIFKGRFNKIQYLISLLITLIFSFVLTLVVILSFQKGVVYQEPTSLIFAETEMQAAKYEYYNHNYNPDLPDEINKNERLKRDKNTAQDIFYQEKRSYRNNQDFLTGLFLIILNIPLALFLIASGTKRSHDIGDSGILQIALPIYIWVLLFKNSVKADNLYGTYLLSDINIRDNQNNIETLVSEICPNCKNPNTQNLKICEWCGNQIA